MRFRAAVFAVYLICPVCTLMAQEPDFVGPLDALDATRPAAAAVHRPQVLELQLRSPEAPIPTTPAVELAPTSPVDSLPQPQPTFATESTTRSPGSNRPATSNLALEPAAELTPTWPDPSAGFSIPNQPVNPQQAIIDTNQLIYGNNELDGKAFGFDDSRLYNPLEGPQLRLAGKPTFVLSACHVCDEWEGYCGIKDLEYGCNCGGLKANPGHLGIPWLRSKENCDQATAPPWRRQSRTSDCQSCEAIQ